MTIAPEQIEKVAKAINGPYDDSHVSDKQLRELQEYKWHKMTSTSEKNVRRAQAYAAIVVLERMKK